jgi:chemotaxis protein CheD
MSIINVGIADYKIIKNQGQIMTVGLGSCLGVVLYDDVNKIAGLVHILLSESKNEKILSNKAKFADTGITLLYEELKKQGANPKFIKAKIAGGAHMFNMKDSKKDLTIGEKNVKVCKETLLSLKVPIVAEDIFGDFGRTIVFDMENFKLKIKSVGKNDKFI